MTAIVVQGDARRLPLPDGSVDLIVTSPPYFALRSYTDAGQHYAGQIGSEATPSEYLDALWACTREWIRCLKPEGSIFVNLGDKYAQNDERSRNGNGNRQKVENVRTSVLGPTISLGRKDNGSTRTKSLMGIPWRYAIGCIDQLGLILRAEIIWSKPNGLPESVTDRVRRSHEQWFHMTKQPRYYSALDEIRKPHSGTHPRRADGTSSPKQSAGVSNGIRRGYLPDTSFNPLGKLPGTVWQIPSEPLNAPKWRGEEPDRPHRYFFGKDHDQALVEAQRWQRRSAGRALTRMIDHFAAFPTEWPRRLILGWSPPGICTACGQGRRPVVLSKGETPRQRLAQAGPSARHKVSGQGLDFAGRHAIWRSHSITGYSCGCDTVWPIDAVQSSTRLAIVLDPFGGTGTVALVAHALGRVGVTVDRSLDYCRQAVWRTTDRGQLAKAMRVPKSAPVPDGQAELFEVGA